MARIIVDDDPLTLAIQPPPNETPADRAARERAEAKARKIRSVHCLTHQTQRLPSLPSDEIDEQLRQDREGDRRRKKAVKLLLLGTLNKV